MRLREPTTAVTSQPETRRRSQGVLIVSHRSRCRLLSAHLLYTLLYTCRTPAVQTHTCCTPAVHLPYRLTLPYTSRTPAVQTVAVHRPYTCCTDLPYRLYSLRTPCRTDLPCRLPPYTCCTPLGTGAGTDSWPAVHRWTTDGVHLRTLFVSFGICRLVSGWLCLARWDSRKRIIPSYASHRPSATASDVAGWTVPASHCSTVRVTSFSHRWTTAKSMIPP